MLEKDLACCIRAIDYSETSQVLTLFGRKNGKISVIAKGTKRTKSPFGGPIEPLSLGQIVFAKSSTKNLGTLTEFEHQGNFYMLRNNLFALNCSLFATELLDKLTTENDAHPELFDSFMQFMKDSQDTSDSKEILTFLILFQLSLLKEIGLAPKLDSCTNCKSPIEHQVSSIEHRVYFSSRQNGLLCRDCEASFPEKFQLSKNAASCLTNLNSISDAKEKTLNEIEKVLVYHFTELLHKPPGMAKSILK